MENKKTKLTFSGGPKKSFKNIEIAKTQGKNSVVIEKTKSKWPGAHTWLVPANDNVPSWIKGNSDYVALRQSVHPSIIELSEKLNSVITSTSANISSEPPAKNANEVRNLFRDEVSILEGELGEADKPTPIQNLITDEWIRN